MTQRNSAKGKRRRKKPEKLEFVQDFIPIKDLRHGIIETTDGRYIKILEIEPINFMLRSDDEQFSIISTFASWLKISPMSASVVGSQFSRRYSPSLSSLQPFRPRKPRATVMTSTTHSAMTELVRLLSVALRRLLTFILCQPSFQK